MVYDSKRGVNIVPSNRYGIIHQPCSREDAFTDTELMRIINGPIAASERSYQEELKKPVILYKGEMPKRLN